jgi:3-hydroxyisobutyrate dehydrogenase-like beta-hydroxyacid dehydrogenase
LTAAQAAGGAEAATLRAGVIGLGAMGLAMAGHIAARGFSVAGFDIDGAAMARSTDKGIVEAPSPAEVGRHCDIALIMVQTDQQVEAVVCNDGLLATMAAGSVICVASSTLPRTCQRLAGLAVEKGIGLLDTPVVNGQRAADNATLTVFVGGEEQWLERARPVLAAFSSHIVLVGDSGHGQIAKAVNNMLLWSCICANYEALSLGRALGADMPRLLSAMQLSSGANAPLARWGTSTGKWASKDLEGVLNLAEEVGLPLPLNGLVDQLIKTIDQAKMKAIVAA